MSDGIHHNLNHTKELVFCHDYPLSFVGVAAEEGITDTESMVANDLYISSASENDSHIPYHSYAEVDTSTNLSTPHYQQNKDLNTTPNQAYNIRVDPYHHITSTPEHQQQAIMLTQNKAYKQTQSIPVKPNKSYGIMHPSVQGHPTVEGGRQQRDSKCSSPTLQYDYITEHNQ